MPLNCDRRHSPLFTLHTRTCSHTRLVHTIEHLDTVISRALFDPTMQLLLVLAVTAGRCLGFTQVAFSGSCCF